MRPLPADIAPDAIEKHLRTQRIGRPLEVLAEVGSTNDVALAAARRGEREGLAVVADLQTEGRGRRGRRWVSPPGVGLYLSVLLRPILPPRRAPLISLAAGVAVAEGIVQVAGLSPRLKWPNDVQLGGKKVAGILAELAADGDVVGHIVLGIGLNLNHQAADFPEEVRGEATSLFLESGCVYDRGSVASAVLNALDRWYLTFCGAEFPTILEAYRRRSATLGRPVEVLEGDGGRWRGEAVDLDPEGALLVRDEKGKIHLVVAGDVSIRGVVEEAAPQRTSR
jgi:BirA family biotin operon repressor/biotin-[acetyl-CoA-carboxylase] ligase